MESYSIEKRNWYCIKDIVKEYPIVETRFFDYHKDLFWEQVPNEYQASFDKTKKKGYFRSKSYNATRYVEKEWFDTYKEDIFSKLEKWHDEQLLELDIPLINTLKEFGEQPTIDNLDCPFDIDDIKLYIDLKYLEKNGDLGCTIGSFDIEYGLLVALCVAEWMQDGNIVDNVLDNISYMTLMFCVPVTGTTESLRYKWYERMIDGLENYVDSHRYWGCNTQKIRKELDRSTRIETLDHIKKYAKKFNDDINNLIAKIEISSSDSESSSDTESRNESN